MDVDILISIDPISAESARRCRPARSQSFFWELVLTAILMSVIMAVATDTHAVGEAAAIAIGGTMLYQFVRGEAKAPAAG